MIIIKIKVGIQDYKKITFQKEHHSLKMININKFLSKLKHKHKQIKYKLKVISQQMLALIKIQQKLPKILLLKKWYHLEVIQIVSGQFNKTFSNKINKKVNLHQDQNLQEKANNIAEHILNL